MSNWKETTIDFGRIRKNTSKVFTFTANRLLPPIESIDADCGCTTLKWDAANRLLTVTYKAGEIPKHLGNNNQIVNKKIRVLYKDGTLDILTIKGIKKH